MAVPGQCRQIPLVGPSRARGALLARGSTLPVTSQAVRSLWPLIPSQPSLGVFPGSVNDEDNHRNSLGTDYTFHGVLLLFLTCSSGFRG